MAIQSITQNTLALNQTNLLKENAAKILKSLQTANSSFFFSHSLQLDFLKNQTSAIPILAQWLYDEWHTYDSSLTIEKLIQSLNKRLNDNQVPITFVVLKGTVPVGMIALKEQADPEFSDLSKGTLWMGSLHVDPSERCKGLGTELLKFAILIGYQLGYKEVLFYTSNPKNLDWYHKNGANIIDKERTFHNHKVVVMSIPTGKV